MLIARCGGSDQAQVGAASIGVVRVNSKEKLRDIFLRVQTEMAAVRIDAGAIHTSSSEDGVRPACVLAAPDCWWVALIQTA